MKRSLDELLSDESDPFCAKVYSAFKASLTEKQKTRKRNPLVAKRVKLKKKGRVKR